MYVLTKSKFTEYTVIAFLTILNKPPFIKHNEELKHMFSNDEVQNELITMFEECNHKTLLR